MASTSSLISESSVSILKAWEKDEDIPIYDYLASTWGSAHANDTYRR